jgi:hypothetical protein
MVRENSKPSQVSITFFVSKASGTWWACLARLQSQPQGWQLGGADEHHFVSRTPGEL